MSWAYADKPEMTAQLAEAYTIAGNDNNALVIPAGLAFARSISKQPELNLYAPDKRHPSLGRDLSRDLRGVCGVDRTLAGRQPLYRRASTRRPRHSCRTSHGRPCRNITGNRMRRLDCIAALARMIGGMASSSRRGDVRHAFAWPLPSAGPAH